MDGDPIDLDKYVKEATQVSTISKQLDIDSYESADDGSDKNRLFYER